MGIQDEIKRGTIAVFIAKYSNILIGIGINSVLARLLSPAEYGTLGVVTVFISFFYILSDIGIGVAIVQNQTLSDKDISDIFKVSIVLSGFFALGFFMLSYGIAWYFESDKYIPIGQLLSLTVFFSSMAVVPKNILTKSKAFKLLGTLEVAVALSTGGMVIVLAKLGLSYYALAWRSVLSSLILFSCYVYFSKLSLEKGFSFSGIRKIARYSFFQFAFNAINYFSRNLDSILVGKFMGNKVLGVYNQAYQLMMYPVANLTHVITPVVHPVLAKFADQPNIIFDEYMKLVRVLSMLGVPISIFIYFASHEIIYTLLGQKWIEVIPVIKIFSVTIWIQMITSSIGAIYQAAGRTDLLFKLGVFSAFTIVGSILVGIFHYKSLTYMAICISAAFAINFLANFYVLVTWLFKKNFLSFLKIVASQLPLALVLVTVLMLYQFSIPHDSSAMGRLYSLTIKGSIVAIGFALFNFKQIKYLLSTFNRRSV